MTSHKQGFAPIAIVFLVVAITGITAFFTEKNRQRESSIVASSPTPSPATTQNYIHVDNIYDDPNPNWRKFSLPNCNTAVELPPAIWDITEIKKEGESWTWYQMNGISNIDSTPLELQITCNPGKKEVQIVNECKKQDGTSKLIHFTIAGNKINACYEFNAKKLQPFSALTKQGSVGFYAFGFDESTLQRIFESLKFPQ